MKNLFEKMLIVFIVDEFIDKVFRRVEKVVFVFIFQGGKVVKVCQREELRVRIVFNVVRDNFRKIFDRIFGVFILLKFYWEFVDIFVDCDQFYCLLVRVNWVIKMIRNLEQRYVEKICYERDLIEIVKFRRQFYGRVVDIFKDIGDDFEYFNRVRDVLKEFFVVDFEFLIVVIVGYFNVGKSIFLRVLINVKLEVVSYLFIIKGINVGQFEEYYFKYQVIDMLGLFDRFLSERNEVEKQVIFVLKYFGDVIVYIFDLSEYCGFLIEEQMYLFEEIYLEFGEFLFIVVFNKVDIVDEEKMKMIEEFVKFKGFEFFRIFVFIGEGFDEFKKRVIEIVKFKVEEFVRKIMEKELRKFREEVFQFFFISFFSFLIYEFFL